MIITASSTLSELSTFFDQERIAVEIFRWARTEPTRSRTWFVRVATTDIFPRRIGEAYAATPAAALVEAIRAARREKVIEDV